MSDPVVLVSEANVGQISSNDDWLRESFAKTCHNRTSRESTARYDGSQVALPSPSSSVRCVRN